MHWEAKFQVNASRVVTDWLVFASHDIEHTRSLLTVWVSSVADEAGKGGVDARP